MFTRLFHVFALATALLVTNGVPAQNIAHGVKVVVLDAGHGGRFPGARYGGVNEKDIALKVVLRLGSLIEEQMPGVQVVYTRKSDKSLSDDLAADLQARADVANRAGGDLFISIHVNAAGTSARAAAVKGVETLIMGESSKEQQYNQNALFENNREDLIDMSDARMAAIVRAYIQNLQFTYGEYSMALARCMQNNYTKAGRVSRGIKPQLLRVLYATDMPGVLTEIGFLSNAQEAAYMKSEKGQEEIARSLLKAVQDYSNYVLGARQAEEGVTSTAQPTPASAESTPEVQSPAKRDKNNKNEEPPAPKSVARPEVKPDPKTTEATTPKNDAPLRYAVQVMASPSKLPHTATHFKSYAKQVKCYLAEGAFAYKYCVGEYSTRDAAQKRLAEVRKTFPQAFVVSCRGTRIAK